MTVSIDLTVGSRRAVLTVPSEAVHTGAPPWLLAIERDHVVRRDLTLGLRGQGTVEVLVGLDLGATVALPEHQRLVVGHDPRLAERCDRIVEIVDGRICSDGRPATRP
jgi:hypothetical protein